MTIFSRSAGIAAQPLRRSPFDDGAYPPAAVGAFRNARFARNQDTANAQGTTFYAGSVETTKRILDLYAALDAAGLYQNLIFAFAPDLVTRDAAGLIDVVYDGSRQQLALPRGSPTLCPSADAGPAAFPRRVADYGSAVARCYHQVVSLPRTLIDGATGLTAVAVVQHNGTGTTARRFMRLSTAGGGEYLEMLRTSGAISATVRQSANGATTNGVGDAVTNGEWMTHTAKYDAVNGKLYQRLNANAATSVDVAAKGAISALETGSLTLSLGWTSTTNPIVKLSDLLLFNKPLSDAEEATVRAAQKAANPQLP